MFRDNSELPSPEGVLRIVKILTGASPDKQELAPEGTPPEKIAAAMKLAAELPQAKKEDSRSSK